MKKRFMDTNIFNNPWFRKLSLKHKLLWFYCCLNADVSGVINVDWENASFQIGEDVTEDDLSAEIMDGNIVRHPTKNKYFIIVKFCEFHYGHMNPLSDTSKSGMMKAAFHCLKNHGLTFPVSLCLAPQGVPPRKR